MDVTGDNVGTVGFLTDWGVDTQCEESSITGQVFPGTSVDVGQVAGQIDELTFSDCLVFGSLPVIIEMEPTANVQFEVAAHPANAGDPVDVTITGIDAHLHSTGSTPWACELQATGSVSGTITPGDANADGYVDIDPSNFTLDLVALDGTNTGTEAPIDPVTGLPTSCAGQIASGDTANMNGSFTLDTDGAGAINHG